MAFKLHWDWDIAYTVGTKLTDHTESTEYKIDFKLSGKFRNNIIYHQFKIQRDYIKIENNMSDLVIHVLLLWKWT